MNGLNSFIKKPRFSDWLKQNKETILNYMSFVRDIPEIGRRKKKGIFQANAKKNKASSTIRIKQNGIQDEIYQEE